MDRLIVHIDFDSFFASVEQQDNPLLRGRPIGVTATNGRTCIIAASREAKAYGVKSPSRVFEAQKICPMLQTVGANFVRYWEVSKKFIAICKDFSPTTEVFSLDEVFMDMTATMHLFNNTDAFISMFKKRLSREVGPYITASVGVSHNKLLAKLASGLKKPNGVCFITPENLDATYRNSRLTDICGIGYRIHQRLLMLGVTTLLDLRVIPERVLLKEFGPVAARFLKNVGHGVDSSPVIPYTEVSPVKSVGRNYCLPKNEYNTRVVVQNVYELCEEVGIKLRRLSKKAKTVGISLRGSQNTGGMLSVPRYIDAGKDIFALCNIILRANRGESRSDNAYVRQISVWVAGLQDTNCLPLSFFDSPKQNELQKTIDTLNDRFGDHTIRNGFLLYADKLTTVPNGYGSDTYERTKLAKEEV